MYADRSARRTFNPGSLGVAVGINAAVVAALLYAAPEILPLKPKPPMTGIDVYTPPPPQPPPPEPEVKPRDEAPTTDTVVLPPPPRPDVFDTPVAKDSGFVVTPGPTGFEGGVEGGTGTAPVDPPRPLPPVIVAPAVDPRYADLFQPSYPAEERRAGREGRVVARVLVGPDGRVRQIERVSAATDAFWRVTEEQAKRRWRFTPGTRDGVPVEAWRTMAVTFRLEGLD